VDASIATAGLTGSLCLLYTVERQIGLRNMLLACPPLMSSGIIFFAGQTPPDLKGMTIGTFGCLFIYYLVSSFYSVFDKELVTGLTAGFTMLSYKLCGFVYAPAVTLSLLMAKLSAAQAIRSSVPDFTDISKDLKVGLEFLLFPWLPGNLFLYLAAQAFSTIRTHVRHMLMKKALNDVCSIRMRETFKKFDTSGDGNIDAVELKIALRSLIGVDVSLGDCEWLIAEADGNGDHMIDYDEFAHICQRT
jgi:hypothetical protein